MAADEEKPVLSEAELRVAVTTLWERQRPALLRYAKYLGYWKHGDHEDLVQEMFVRCLEGRRTFSRDEKALQDLLQAIRSICSHGRADGKTIQGDADEEVGNFADYALVIDDAKKRQQAAIAKIQKIEEQLQGNANDLCVLEAIELGLSQRETVEKYKLTIGQVKAARLRIIKIGLQVGARMSDEE